MRYRILGVTQAEDDQGTVVALGGSRLRALLTALALRPGAVATPESLIDEVWTQDPPQDAPAALQALVGRLRRTVGKDAVTSEPGGYRLAATQDDVDLFVFERFVLQGTAALARGDAQTAARTLDAALALWRGPALADLPDRAAATRPEALHLEATRARLGAALLLGHASDVVPELKEMTAAHPYDEPLHVLLIRALRDTGRGADALAAYEAARRALADDLGTDPGPELRALHTELLAPTEPHTPPARTAVGPGSGGNIRPRLTTFVGREPELDAIRSELHRARLVTLTGPGGSGKTRLAEEAAAGLPQAWLVELAPLDQPEAVPGAVVSALGLRETVLRTTELTGSQDDPVALLVEYCAPRSQLLLLDNCEHVIGAAADLAETLLTRCPGLTILATSREPLGVPGELVRPVEPLLPAQAHRLFAERAAAVRPDTDTVLGDKEAVAEICRRLDGLPLAIELAAARLRLLTPRQIADRLDDRFRLLTAGSRTVLPRQQTLRAVVDWSWDLLDERERTLLREVSVFAGGWDLEAAEAVCGESAAELIGALVDKSLIVAGPCEADRVKSAAEPRPARARGGIDMRLRHDEGPSRPWVSPRSSEVESGGEAGSGGATSPHRPAADEPHNQRSAERPGSDGMRYRMLETIHEYAVERAAELPELRAAAERRHRAWVRALVEEAEPLLRSAGQLPWMSRLETELDNIRAALHRAITAADEAEAGALTLAMGWFWWLRNYRREGAEWTDRVVRLGAALDTPPGSAPDPVDAFLASPDRETRHPLHTLRMDVRMLHLFLRAEVDPLDGLDDRMRQYAELVRAHFERGGPDAARLPGLVWPMMTFILRGPQDVRAVMDIAVAHCRAHGDDWAVAVVLMFRTHMVVDSPGGMAGVDDDLAELRVLTSRSGDRWLAAQVCSAAGEAAMARGRPAQAKGEYEEGLRLAYEVGAYAETPFLIARLAEIAYRTGDRQAALTTLEEARVAGERYGVPEARAYVRLLRAHMALDDKDTARARELVDAVRAEIGQTSPPPQFTVMLNSVEAMVTVAESGPENGLPKLADTIREAIEKRCADVIVATLVDCAAALLTDLGDHPRAARLLAAAEQWREGEPRPHPEDTQAESAEAAARAGLGPVRYATEHSRGAALTPADALGELDEVLGAHRAL
ncbi:ATP-binding protein [Streptomyces fulvoviolaceus]|uniref:ATP-binding protein n=1 Tax=Streptomyces fulvoviolaceus TaxID=285535 RepID=UPI0004CA2325|nr:BTAD domain-containing putative transcriptional regulator [Streptomyces fulvoviolaceus]